jgi:hypothetical protein
MKFDFSLTFELNPLGASRRPYHPFMEIPDEKGYSRGSAYANHDSRGLQDREQSLECSMTACMMTGTRDR